MYIGDILFVTEFWICFNCIFILYIESNPTKLIAFRALSIVSSFGQNGVKTRENTKKSTPTDSSNR